MCKDIMGTHNQHSGTKDFNKQDSWQPSIVFLSTERNKKDYNRDAQTVKYVEGQLVWLHEEHFLKKHRKLAPKWSGPFKIVKVFQFGVVDILYKKVYCINMAQLKPFIQQLKQPNQQQR